MKNVLWMIAALAIMLPTAAVAQNSWVKVPDTLQQNADNNNQAADSNAINDPAKMLPQDVEERFKSIRSDPDPDQLVRDAHYWVSNENAHYVWYPYIKDMGGVLSGVGTDQVYMLAGWSNASIVIPMDFDKMIRNLHLAYGAAFLESENIEEFRTYWKKENENKMKAAVDKHFPTESAAIMKAWRSGAREVQGRFNLIAKKYGGGKAKEGEVIVDIPTFITDETQYQRIRQLWQNHRVFPVCGDLTGNMAMLDIAKALKDSNLQMTILYPSNAEQYFEYDAVFRRNIIQMPFADNSLILRTRPMRFLGLADGDEYHYNMQSGENFKAWLQTTNIKAQNVMLRKRTKTETNGLSILDYTPEPSQKAPPVAPMP